MTDNTSAVPHSEAPSVDIQAYATKAKEAVLAADLADKERDRRCVGESPQECLALTFDKLSIQPKLLLHALDLPSSFKCSLNTMASEWAALRVRDEHLKRQG